MFVNFEHVKSGERSLVNLFKIETIRDCADKKSDMLIINVEDNQFWRVFGNFYHFKKLLKKNNMLLDFSDPSINWSCINNDFFIFCSCQYSDNSNDLINVLVNFKSITSIDNKNDKACGLCFSNGFIHASILPSLIFEFLKKTNRYLEFSSTFSE
jgi:hypothetical protein